MGMIVFVRLSTRRRDMFPRGLQNFFEMVVEGLFDMVSGVIGKEEARRYAPLTEARFPGRAGQAPALAATA